MMLVFTMAVVAGYKGTRFTGGDRVAHIRVSTVVTGCAGEVAVVDMFNHNIRIVALGTALRRNPY